MAQLTTPDDPPSNWYLALVTMNYRAAAGKSKGAFDPALYAAELVANHDPLARAELLQLELLTKNLRDISAVRPDVAKTLRKRLVNELGDATNYVGWRMEARIASSLARKGVQFDYVDKPDFSLIHDGQPIAIECTSTNVGPSTPPDKDLGYKITSAVKKKAAMPYSDGSLAIAVDISGITKVRQGKSIDRNEHDGLVKAATSGALTGSVLLFTTGYIRATGDLWFTYTRHDTESISPPLLSFLKQQYPIRPGMRLAPVFYV